MNKLNRLYVEMLKAWNTIVKENAALYMVLDNQEYPITVDSKQTYLPTDNALDTNTADKVFFHPACESIISGETEIFKVVRKLTGMTMFQSFTRYPKVLFNIAAKKSGKSMSGALIDIIEPLREVKGSEQKEIHDLFEQMTVKLDEEDTVDRRFIHFQVTKGGKSKLTGNKVYYRVKPQFPFYAEMARKLNRSEDLPRNQKVDVNGFKISLKALEAAVHIFRVVFPSIDTPDMYTGEALKVDAARLVAYCESYVLVCDDMNTLQNLFRSDFDKANVYSLETGFSEGLENIGELYRQVPPLDYNNQNTDSSDNGSLASRNNLIGSVVNTERDVVQPVGPLNANNQQQVQPVVQGNDGTFINVVRESMQPNESYQNGYWDANTGCFVHHTMSPQGPVMYKVTRYGTLLSREYSTMQQPMYNGYQPYYNNMQQQQMFIPAQNIGNAYGQVAQPNVQPVTYGVQPSNTINTFG